MNRLPKNAARVEFPGPVPAALRSCLTRRGDALFELVTRCCAPGPVRSAVELSMEPEFRRGHGSVFDALALPDESTGIGCGVCWSGCRTPPRADLPACSLSTPPRTPDPTPSTPTNAS